MKDREWLEKFDINTDRDELVLAFESAMHFLREAENTLKTIRIQNYQRELKNMNKSRRDRELQDDYVPYQEDERER